jgi:hypothetical protein
MRRSRTAAETTAFRSVAGALATSTKSNEMDETGEHGASASSVLLPRDALAEVRARMKAGAGRNCCRALLVAKRASAHATPETRIDQRAVVTIEPEPDDRSVAKGFGRSATGQTRKEASGTAAATIMLAAQNECENQRADGSRELSH